MIFSPAFSATGGSPHRPCKYFLRSKFYGYLLRRYFSKRQVPVWFIKDNKAQGHCQETGDNIRFTFGTGNDRGLRQDKILLKSP